MRFGLCPRSAAPVLLLALTGACGVAELGRLPDGGSATGGAPSASVTGGQATLAGGGRSTGGRTNSGGTATGGVTTGGIPTVGGTHAGGTSTGGTGGVGICGDRVVDLDRGEECDDGNHDAGDGCSPACTLEGTVSTGGRATGGVSSVGGTGWTGGAPIGGTQSGGMAVGGISVGGTRTSSGGTAIGGTATGGRSTGGTATGGRSTGGTATGGTATGGRSTGGTAVGGAATGGTSTGGTPIGGTATGGTLTGGTATGGRSTGGTATGGTGAGGTGGTGGAGGCPPPELRDIEPAPTDDPCARVSTVAAVNPVGHVWGFTNGELYLYTPGSGIIARRLDQDARRSVPLPRDLVSMLYGNPEVELDVWVGFRSTLTSVNPLFRTSNGGQGWGQPGGRDWGTPWTVSVLPQRESNEQYIFFGRDRLLYSVDGGRTFDYASNVNGGVPLEEQLALPMVDGAPPVVTSIARSPNDSLIWVGTYSGHVFVGRDATVPPVWTEVTDLGMPSAPITRITVHPSDPLHAFVTFARQSAGAVWYTDNRGQTWQDRYSAPLPINDERDPEHVVVGASFHPTAPGVAYLVLPDAVYFTRDYGMNWKRSW